MRRRDLIQVGAVLAALIAGPALPQDLSPKGVTLKQRVLGCKGITDAHTYHKLNLQYDKQALLRFQFDKINVEECAPLIEGDTYYVMDRAWHADYTYECLRREGETNCLWTLPVSGIWR